MKLALSKLFITTGTLLIIFSLFLIFQRYSPSRLSFDDYETGSSDYNGNSSTDSTLTLPKYLIMQDIGLNLPIIPAEPPVKGKWSTTYEGVSYLVSTPIPGNRGNSVIYGHNWNSLLGNLKNAKPGQLVEVVFGNGASEKFKIKTIQVVGPNQKDILDNTEDTRITIYTCIGFLDSQRLVVTAEKIEV